MTVREKIPVLTDPHELDVIAWRLFGRRYRYLDDDESGQIWDKILGDAT